MERSEARQRGAFALGGSCARASSDLSVKALLLGQLPLTPGGLGVVEAGLTGTLALAAVPAASAALATLAYRLVSY